LKKKKNEEASDLELEKSEIQKRERRERREEKTDR